MGVSIFSPAAPWPQQNCKALGLQQDTVLAAERLAVLTDGVAALRAIEAHRLGKLPPPEKENVSLLAAVRDIQRLADRLELALAIDGLDDDSVHLRDTMLSMHFTDEDIEAFASLAHDIGWGTPYREEAPPVPVRAALERLAALARRYDRGEFMPPASYFGINSPEA